MDERQYIRGVYKVCPICKESFYVCEPDIWAYKMHIHTNHEKKLVYFNRYSCKRAYEKNYEKQKKARKTETDKRKWEKAHGKKIADTDVFCFDCRYCMSDREDFRYCSCFGCAVRNYKSACKKFRPKYREEVTNGHSSVRHTNAKRA